MQNPLYKKPETPNYATPAAQRAFIEETVTNKELLQKELSVNQAEQLLLGKRIRMMKEFINELPASDPQYSMLLAQVQMDQIELDELRAREMAISQKLSVLR